MEDFIKTLASSAGVCGLILGFHLIRILPALEDLKKGVMEKLDKMANAMNLSSRTELLKLAASPHVHPELKEEAKRMIDELDSEGKQ